MFRYDLVLHELAARGLTQTWLAEAIGVRVGTVSDCLTGKRMPRRTTIASIAKALKLSYADLTTSDGGIAASQPTPPPAHHLPDATSDLRDLVVQLTRAILVQQEQFNALTAEVRDCKQTMEGRLARLEAQAPSLRSAPGQSRSHPA